MKNQRKSKKDEEKTEAFVNDFVEWCETESLKGAKALDDFQALMCNCDGQNPPRNWLLRAQLMNELKRRNK